MIKFDDQNKYLKLVFQVLKFFYQINSPLVDKRLEDLQIQRLTFEGDYNAKASLLKDGSALVMVHRRDGVFHIAMLDLQKGALNVLTETSLDESPSFAPNGSLVIYATQKNEEGILATVSVDGLVKFNLPSSAGDVREPAWSPNKKKIFDVFD